MFEQMELRRRYWNLQRKTATESDGPFEVWEKDGKRLFKWLGAQT